MKNFNVRVYGILVNAKEEVLISDERAYGMAFSKFPGGGLEYGEGLIDGLKREFMEECELPITVVRHVYTTEGFHQSAFNDSQVIAVYYLVQTTKPFKHRIGKHPFDFDHDGEPNQLFRWVSTTALRSTDLTFDTDRLAWQAFLDQV